MARRYATSGQDTNTASTSILGITSTSAIRPCIYDILIGSDATPADNAWEFVLQRYTAAGTATSFTPVALDPGDPASTASSGYAHTVEPTYTASALLLNGAVNQRATFRWVAAPGGELKCPATASNGIGCQSITVAGSAINTVVAFHFEE